MALTATIDKSSGGECRVRLVGAIDEEADLSVIFDQLEETVVFDLSQVNRINSIGLLHWTRKLSSFTANHTAAIEGVSYPLALQANCVADFFAGAEVRSCLAPYYCPRCSQNQLVLVFTSEVDGSPPAKTCGCGCALNFDELASYFAFLGDHP